ncbi:hypothetical protein E5Q_03780 [Mixia osmundae IAM 14324]|uniref:Mitochondrial import inner membrane translocase subunit TIM17 n=1 Tax=Mixia osmundae (strain CBS 9802 / IAM 14324 / JCM 22182 / KY 12970) TaxID=764103 RepID=G7E2P5_MIXOS|nr:hypothetical protein E5Q_03780 [Mixia osmundae IAM 14324]
MAHHDHTRDPCPWVVFNDFGGAFSMGAVGGTIWHGIKGARNSPRGDALIGSIAAIKARAPVVGGNFGIWGGMFSSFDCAVKGVRQKEDAWNAIIAGFFTGGCLAARSGPRSALGSAIGCGILLGVFEGVGVLAGRMFATMNKPQAPIVCLVASGSSRADTFHSDADARRAHDPCIWSRCPHAGVSAGLARPFFCPYTTRRRALYSLYADCIFASQRAARSRMT